MVRSSRHIISCFLAALTAWTGALTLSLPSMGSAPTAVSLTAETGHHASLADVGHPPHHAIPNAEPKPGPQLAEPDPPNSANPVRIAGHTSSTSSHADHSLSECLAACAEAGSDPASIALVASPKRNDKVTTLKWPTIHVRRLEVSGKRAAHLARGPPRGPPTTHGPSGAQRLLMAHAPLRI